ncbi:MAG: xanthine dehydrogenase family protein molybdopterin-binding subunit [Thaumarchaeota archaeon]|nr:xanthine dehydrogenase family protein molybdopterin-binding subunit [Nitrososphaerota archaeon]
MVRVWRIVETMATILKSKKRNVGKSVVRIEDRRLTTGRGSFVDDVKRQGTTYCAILRSPYAHARILKVDATAALAHPNVLAVITGEDVRRLSEPVSPYLGAPVLHYCLGVDKVRFVGEPVAAVAATDRYSAVDALELIDVEYEPLPTVLNPLEAMEETSPKLFEELGTNVVWHKRFEFGNVDDAFERADIKFSHELKLHRYTSTPLETFVSTSWFNTGTRILDVWSNTQQAGIMFKYLCRALRLPGHRVRMRVPADVGGGFGLKCGGLPYITITSLLSMKTGRPVTWVETRSEHLTAQGHSAAGVFYIEAAATREGELIGLKIKDVEEEGGYLTWASIHNVGKLAGINGNYRVKNIVYDGYAVATNKAPAVPNRGIGKKGMNFIIERTMDRLADELSLSRVEIRRRNLISKSSFPYETPSGQVYDNSDYERLLDRVLEISDFASFRESALRKAGKEGRYLGMGVTLGIEPGTVNFSYHSTGDAMPLRSGAAEGARVKVESTGKVTVMVGSVSNGQGHETAIAQVVSDELQVDMSDVTVIGEFDTFTSPWTVSSGVYGNKFSALDIGAVIMATRKVKEKMLLIAASKLRTKSENIVIEDGNFFAPSAPDAKMTIGDVADIAYNNLLFLPHGLEPGLEAVHYYSFPEADISSGKGKVRSFLTFASSAHAALVEVDAETGKVTVVKYFVVDDSGNIINPMIVEGQIHGNVAAEASAAILEEMVYDDGGQLLSSTFVDYLKPTVKEMFDIQSEFIPTPSPFTILGTKSVGDGPAIPVLATIASAVEDALSPFGVKIDSMPLTPEKIRNAILGAKRNVAGIPREDSEPDVAARRADLKQT